MVTDAQLLREGEAKSPLVFFFLKTLRYPEQSSSSSAGSWAGGCASSKLLFAL